MVDIALEALVPALDQDRSASILAPLQGARRIITPGLHIRMGSYAGSEGDEAVRKNTEVELYQLVRSLGRASYEIDRWFEANGLGRRGVSLRDCEFQTEMELVQGFDRQDQAWILKTWRDFRNAIMRNDAYEYTLARDIGQPDVYFDPDPQHECKLRADGQRVHPWHSFELINGIFEVWVDSSIRLLYFRVGNGAILLDVVH